MRAFGLAGGDLDIRLDDADRPAVVTSVLAVCLDGIADREAAARAVWAWTLAERLQGLIAVVLAGGATNPPWQTRCAHCKVAIEIDVPLEAFAAPPRQHAITCRSLDGHLVTARLPRGDDARAWHANASDACAIATMLVEDVDGETPAPGWRLPPDWLGPLADALAEVDPLTVLQLQALCPGCGHANVIDFDLEGWLLGLCSVEQQHLIDDVHRLAGAYHWSEAAIAALPPWRRRAYLARIDRETVA
ncbi:hypothetical protein GCM10007857_46600 [Bradyrhizobium iriomotense]|uniref:Phage baseplate protein n=2 Tax=Bradyrhizobium iriomotense TaxID=441950 RepID=A0ABQ6B2B6_9BRAD|nr:hypothetical protein GCM10007857_46600 [Bradyrhizobium iriomotense]